MRALLFSALTLTATLPALAQEPPTARVAIVAPMQILQATVRGKILVAELEVKGKDLQTKYNAKVEELKGLDQQLKSPGLSDEGRAKVQRDLQDGQLALKRLEEDSQKELGAIQQRVFGTFSKEIEPIIDELAKEWKLQLVLQYSEQSALLFAYTDKAWAMSFTNEVAKRYDAKYPSAAGAATPAPKPAPKPATPKK